MAACIVSMAVIVFNDTIQLSKRWLDGMPHTLLLSQIRVLTTQEFAVLLEA